MMLCFLLLRTIIMERCCVIAILMAHSVLNVKNLVASVHVNQTLLGDVVRPVVLDFMASLTANHVTVPQLRSVKLTQVRFKHKLLEVMIIKENSVVSFCDCREILLICVSGFHPFSD